MYLAGQSSTSGLAAGNAKVSLDASDDPRSALPNGMNHWQIGEDSTDGPLVVGKLMRRHVDTHLGTLSTVLQTVAARVVV